VQRGWFDRRRAGTPGCGARWIALAATALLCAAPPAGASERRTPDQLARHSIELLQSGDLEGVQTLFAADVLPQVEYNALLLLHHAIERIPDPEIRFVHRAAAHADDRDDNETWAYQLRDETRSILLLFKIRTRDAQPSIAHVEWQPSPLDLRDRFPFALGGVPTPYYLVLIALICFPLLTIYALALCVRRSPRAWGLWALFILLGVGELGVLWLPRPFHESYVAFEPLSARILGVELTREPDFDTRKLLGVSIEKIPPYDPWRVSVSLPLGALLFLWRQRRRGGRDAVAGGAQSPEARTPSA